MSLEKTTFDIVIAHRGPEMGLWMTLASCEAELKRLRTQKPDFYKNLDYRYWICHNGDEKLDSATLLMIDHFKNTGRWGDMWISPDPMAPPTARNTAARLGYGKYIFFLDNHVMVEPGYFDSALDTFENQQADAVHSVTKFWPGDVARFHYRFTLETNFWAYQVDRPKKETAYRIAGAAHGGFAVRRLTWAQLGGYWDGFTGYGGEEMYWELLMGLTDKRNFLNPAMSHWHHPGNRPYERDKSMDFLKNMMMCAAIIGGERWLAQVCSGLKVKEWQKPEAERREIDWATLANSAYASSKDQFYKVKDMAKRTLNEQLVLYPRIGAAM